MVRMNLLLGRDRVTDIESGYVDTGGGEGEGGTDWEIVQICIHYHVYHRREASV